MSDNTKQDNLYTIAFYNLENLFDIYDNSNTLDGDFTPKGKKKWNAKRYNRKLQKMSSVISQIGTDNSFTAPVIVGLAEVENLQVITDLINTKVLQEFNYGIAHFDSPDERGIDVALIYQKEHFEFIDSETVTLYIYQETGERDYTRDVLLVKGKLKGVPTLGDNVWMGTGSIIIGKIQIGSNVLIAPNAFVNFSVPSNSTVIGNPARIIHMNNNPVDGYINDILDR